MVENELPRTETRPARPSRSSPSQALDSIPSPAEPEEVREEMAVGEDDREELTIGLAILVARARDRRAARRPIGPVEARDQLDQRRLAAAVSPGQDDELAGPERQVDGAEREACVIVPVAIGESDALQADRVAKREPPWPESAGRRLRLRVVRASGIRAWTLLSDARARPRIGTQVRMMSSGLIR